MLIKACLNGSRRPEEHKRLPLSSDELAEAAEAAVRAGAGALHIHPRSADGVQTLDPDTQAAALSAVRARCPAIPIGVSTGIWIEPDPERRRALVAAWRTLPDFASVNFNEPQTLELCADLLARGIGVEAGIGTVEDVQLLVSSGLAPSCLRILIEPEDEAPDSALETAQRIIAALDAGSVKAPRLLHGAEEAAWPVLELALRQGYDVRIGLEDTLYLLDGRLAADNAELVAAARELLGREAQA